MLRVLVCVSGGGTNLQAIIDAGAREELGDTGIVRVISNNPNAYALERTCRILGSRSGRSNCSIQKPHYQYPPVFDSVILRNGILRTEGSRSGTCKRCKSKRRHRSFRG